MRQTIEGVELMLIVSFNTKEFIRVDSVPQDISFTPVSFVNNVTLPLVNRHARQLEDIGCRKLHLHFDNSKCHTARHVQEQMASSLCVRVPHPTYSPGLAIANFYLFGRLKQQLSGRILDSEENVLEMITEILSELPKDKVKRVFVHWKERCQWVADHVGSSIRISETPSCFDIVSLDP
jgi:hypothetical protein